MTTLIELLPPLPETVKHAYLELLAELESHITSLTAQLGSRISCKPGCSSCCEPFDVLPLEAAHILHSMSTISRPQTQSQSCVFLIQQLCSIYSCRPIICRTQGLAIAYIDSDNEAIEVSACPINFPEDCTLETEDLLFLDIFNQRLFELNSIYIANRPQLANQRIPLTLLAPAG